MRIVNNRIGICIMLALLLSLTTAFTSENWVRPSKISDQSETTTSSNEDLQGSRNTTSEVAVTNIAYEGGVEGWELREAGRYGNYSIGIVGKVTRFTVTVANNMRNAINNVDLYCEILTTNTTLDRPIQEIHNNTIRIANINGGAQVNVQFSYKFRFSFIYNITASVNVTGDLDRTNDRFSLNGWVNKWADDCESGEGVWTHVNRMGGADTWHLVDSALDQNGDHTKDSSWYMGEANGQYQNNLDVELISPEFDLSHMYTDYFDLTNQPTYAFKMVGTRADVEDKFYIDDLTYDNFGTVRNVFTNPGEIGGFNAWSFMRWYSDLNRNGQEDPDEPKGLGVPMNGFWGSQWRTIRFRFRFTSDAAGVSSGYYIDDVILFGFETYVEDTTPLPQIQNVVTWDRQFDGGGHMYVGWDKCIKWDFERYDLYADTSPIYNVSGMTPLISNITDGGNITHLINEIHGTPLLDDTPYYFAVTVTDIWGNVNLEVINGSGKCIDNKPVGVSGLAGADVPDDEGFNINISWDPNISPDFGYFNVYLDEDEITNLDDLPPVAENVTETSMLFGNLTNGEEYYFAVTSVDESLPGNENDTVTMHNAIGPIIPIDNLEPPKVANIIAYDSPGDLGSSITVSWDPCPSPDFDHYMVYISDEKIRNISGLPVEVDDLGENHTVLTTINSSKLKDEVDYYIAVVAVDDSGNYNMEVTSSKRVSSWENIPPSPLTIIEAKDTPDDEGNTITLRWLTTSEPDFDHYNIYISNHSFDWVGDMEPALMESDKTVQLLMINRMDNEPLVNFDVEYWLAITAVDRLGNEDHNVDSHGPVVCLENIPPDQLDVVEAYDTPNDAGGSITIEFETSKEDDVDYYEVFVARAEFKSTEGRAELVIPANESNRENSTIITVITTRNGEPLGKGIGYYFGVAATDRSGNRDSGLRSIGPVRCWENIPPEKVKGLVAYDKPDDGGGVLIVEWNESAEADFAYYQVFVFERDIAEILPTHVPLKLFQDQTSPTQVILPDETKFEFDQCKNKDLENGEEYWVAVVVYDTIGNHDRFVKCYGPAIPLKNIFPSLEIPDSYPSDIVMMLNDKLILSVNITDPLDDEYYIYWYVNGIRKNSFKDEDRFIQDISKAVNFNVSVELAGEDGTVFDSHTWNITVSEPKEEPVSTWDNVKSNSTSLAIGLIVIFIAILIVLMIIIRKKRKQRIEEELVVPIHIVADDFERFGMRGTLEGDPSVDVKTETLSGVSASEEGGDQPSLKEQEQIGSGTGPEMLALPPGKEDFEGEEKKKGDGGPEMDEIFAPLDGDKKKKIKALPSGKKTVSRKVKRKVRRKKAGSAGAEEKELLQLPPGKEDKAESEEIAEETPASDEPIEGMEESEPGEKAPEETASGSEIEVQSTEEADSQLDLIAREYQDIQGKALEIRDRIAKTEEPEEKQVLIGEYQELEKKVIELQQAAEILQKEEEAEVAAPVTVQCYSCDALLTVEDSARPVQITCPTCGAESILEA